jgi:ribosome-associated protein
MVFEEHEHSRRRESRSRPGEALGVVGGGRHVREGTFWRMSARIPPFLEVTPRVRIPAWEIRLSYAASGGPGGQNVNKVASKAVLHWSPSASSALSPAEKAYAIPRLRSRLSTEGELVLSADRNRDQPRNVEDVLARLVEVLREALHRDPPRRKSRPTKGSKERRLTAKRHAGAIKRNRRVGEQE